MKKILVVFLLLSSLALAKGNYVNSTSSGDKWDNKYEILNANYSDGKKLRYYFDSYKNCYYVYSTLSWTKYETYEIENFLEKYGWDYAK